MRSVKTTCPYCGVGCGIIASTLPSGTIEIKGDTEHPANYGRLCSKGSALAETLGLEQRLLAPESDGEIVSWELALNTVAKRFQKTVEEFGPDSVAFYVSGQILTEDYYVANKLMKGFIGSANIDTNSRLCMASSVAGHKRAFGSDTVPGNYEDLELADLLVIVGSNLAWCHPVLYQRIAAARAFRPTMKIVVLDPRRTVTADMADLHLPIKSDGDTALFNALLAFLVDSNSIDSDYIENNTTGFSQALAESRLSTQRLSLATGLDEESILEFFQLFADTEKTVTVFSQGVNQSRGGTDKVNAIINCHLATSRIGKPGMGPFSVTGQPNAMGGREVGGLANMLAAHMDIENPDHQAIVSTFWNAPNLAQRTGLKAVDMFQAVASGQIKALWVMGTNPVVSMPDSSAVERAIQQCPFVVVSDVVAETDTLRHAHVKLPSSAWGEKSGTVTNSERRISRQRSFMVSPGKSMPDWWQLSQVAQRMGFNGFEYQSPHEIFNEHVALTTIANDGQRDLDLGGLANLSEFDYNELTPIQWPAPKGKSVSARVFADGQYYTPDRKARFVANASFHQSDNVLPDTLEINTGRIRDQWHTMTRTGLSPRNSSHLSEPYCEINPEDAAARSISHGAIVNVENDLGLVQVRALISDRQAQGSLFLPIHWTDQYASKARIDCLIAAVVDPVSGQPALKQGRATVLPASMAGFGFLISQHKPDVSRCDYWALARCEGGWRLEFANENSLSVAEVFPGLGAADVDVFDRARHEQKAFWFNSDTLETGVYFSATPVKVSRAWICEQFLSSHDTGTRARLAAGRPGRDQSDKGAIVCSCFSVGSKEIELAISNGCTTIAAVGKACKAGTNCGSCQCEISGLIASVRLLSEKSPAQQMPIEIFGSF